MFGLVDMINSNNVLCMNNYSIYLVLIKSEKKPLIDCKGNMESIY